MDNRAKAEIKQINCNNSRRDTFNGRRTGLFKKAKELAILCGCKVAVIIFLSTGELHQFSGSRMDKIISMYLRSVGCRAKAAESSSTSGRLNGTEEPNLSNRKQAAESPSTSGHLTAAKEPCLSNGKQEHKLVEVFTEQVKKIMSRQRPLCKEDEDYVQKLLEMIKEFLVVIRERKENLLKEQLGQSRLLVELEQSRVQEQQYMPESEALNQPVTNLLDLFSPTSSSPSVPFYIPFYVEWDPMQSHNSNSVTSSDSFYNFEADEGDSDTALQLGLPYHVDRKRKEPEKETEFQPFP